MAFRVQKGRFRGRTIPMPPEVRGQGHFTPGIVKEALFQLIENEIGNPETCSFYDLCSGSGQIAIEAASRGFGSVHAVELAPERFHALLAMVKAQDYPIRCHRKDMRRMARLIAAEPNPVVFVDLPYSFWKPIPEVLTRFLEDLGQKGAGFAPILFIQGPEPFPGGEAHSYGGTFLTRIGPVSQVSKNTPV
ncbi:MAG: RsmD family RNA methyltransferase [Spirochaetia bacterium]|nr:RsmD family RNA methyltransferase [Spirochaetia bacterium]